MTKSDYAETIATLLSLDRVMTKDLNNLSIDTLAKMYVNYIQNAKDTNNKMERLIEQSLKRALNKPSLQEIGSAVHNA